MNHIKIRSSERESNSSSSADFYVNLYQPLEGRYKLSYCLIPNSCFNIGSTNNKIYFTDSVDGAVEGTIANGYYDSTNIDTAVQTAVNAVVTGTPYTVTYDVDTSKLTITRSSGTIALTFGTNTTNSSALSLGFTETDHTAALTQTSDNPINLSTFLAYNIDINGELGFVTKAGNQYTYDIPIDTNSGNFVSYTPEWCQAVTFSQSRRLYVRVFDDDHNIVDMNNVNWYMILSRTV